MTARCVGCGSIVLLNRDLVDGYCSYCVADAVEEAGGHQTAFDELAPQVAISTTDSIFGRDIVGYVGLVRGSTVRAKHVGSDALASLKSIVGGEIKGYTELMSNAREEAIYRMTLDAVRLGANGIIGMNFSTSVIAAGAAEITAFGTGVKLEEKACSNKW